MNTGSQTLPSRRSAGRALGIAVLMASVAGCGLVGGGRRVDPVDSIVVSSPVFRDGADLPDRYTCRGAGLNPPLRWSGVPRQAKALALVVDDSDARSGAFVHWVAFNIEADSTEIAEGTVPAKARQARNTAGTTRYVPPCRAGHHYRFSMYALSDPVPLNEGAPLATALAEIAARTIARGRITAGHSK